VMPPFFCSLARRALAAVWPSPWWSFTNRHTCACCVCVCACGVASVSDAQHLLARLLLPRAPAVGGVLKLPFPSSPLLPLR
jgi:hypothetical protein